MENEIHQQNLFWRFNMWTIRKQVGKKHEKSFQDVRMPVSGLKRINNPRNVITKHNNVDKVKIPKLSREKTGHMKNKELEMAHFSRQSLENGKLGRSSNGGDGVWGCRAICLPRTIRKAGQIITFKTPIWRHWKATKTVRICWFKIWKKIKAQNSESDVWGNFTLQIITVSENKSSTEKLKRAFSNFPVMNGKKKIIV